MDKRGQFPVNRTSTANTRRMAANLSANDQTIGNYSRKNNLRARWPVLTPAHRAVRLVWALCHLTWTRHQYQVSQWYGQHIHLIWILSNTHGASWAADIKSASIWPRPTVLTSAARVEGHFPDVTYVDNSAMRICRSMADTHNFDCFRMWCDFPDFLKGWWYHSNLEMFRGQ